MCASLLISNVLLMCYCCVANALLMSFATTNIFWSRATCLCLRHAKENTIAKISNTLATQTLKQGELSLSAS